MRRDTSPVDLETLSAYLDGELDGARRAAVQRHLADHPEAAARLAEYRRRDEALRIAFAKFSVDRAKYPMPRVRRVSPSGRHRVRLGLAAAILGAILGASGWWSVSAILEHRAFAGLAHEAMAAHMRYASRPGQSSLATADQAGASARLSALLGMGVKAPNLSTLGLRLVGVWELPADEGPAALLVYQDADGRDVSCYFKRLAGKHETGFARMAAAATTVIYRLDEQLGYAVVGALPASRLQRIAEVGYLQNSDEGR